MIISNQNFCIFFQAEDGIRDPEMSRGLGDVYKRQGMWANESWGRYWGWDPKETWALISIMVYAFVLHMRLIPGLKSNFAFTVASILSFGSIIMTYFGVNFYLAGLHSYAKDDQEISVLFIGISLTLIMILSLLAYPKYRNYLKNNR